MVGKTGFTEISDSRGVMNISTLKSHFDIFTYPQWAEYFKKYIFLFCLHDSVAKAATKFTIFKLENRITDTIISYLIIFLFFLK